MLQDLLSDFDFLAVRVLISPDDEAAIIFYVKKTTDGNILLSAYAYQCFTDVPLDLAVRICDVILRSRSGKTVYLGVHAAKPVLWDILAKAKYRQDCRLIAVLGPYANALNTPIPRALGISAVHAYIDHVPRHAQPNPTFPAVAFFHARTNNNLLDKDAPEGPARNFACALADAYQALGVDVERHERGTISYRWG